MLAGSLCTWSGPGHLCLVASLPSLHLLPTPWDPPGMGKRALQGCTNPRGSERPMVGGGCPSGSKPGGRWSQGSGVKGELGLSQGSKRGQSVHLRNMSAKSARREYEFLVPLGAGKPRFWAGSLTWLILGVIVGYNADQCPQAPARLCWRLLPAGPAAAG